LEVLNLHFAIPTLQFCNERRFGLQIAKQELQIEIVIGGSREFRRYEPWSTDWNFERAKDVLPKGIVTSDR
jgi:hypothetical protein